MSLQNEIEKLKRTRKPGPMTMQERLEAVQTAYQRGMRGADGCELGYSLMSAEELEENDTVWG